MLKSLLLSYTTEVFSIDDKNMNLLLPMTVSRRETQKTHLSKFETRCAYDYEKFYAPFIFCHEKFIDLLL